jgi:type II secretory pathway pseudopilin PulG
MTIQTEAAKKGFKLTWEGVKLFLFVAMLIAIILITFFGIRGARRMQTELDLARQYRESQERQATVSAGTQTTFDKLQQGQQQREQQAPQVVVLHDLAQQEARREDPKTADFLDADIPQRLLDADRKARERRRLQTR